MASWMWPHATAFTVDVKPGCNRDISATALGGRSDVARCIEGVVECRCHQLLRGACVGDERTEQTVPLDAKPSSTLSPAVESSHGRGWTGLGAFCSGEHREMARGRDGELR
jgi:hypothetical protein